jgi:hypothetical protein
MIASLRKKGDPKDFAIPVHIRLGLSRARIKVIAMFDTEADKNFISYRFLLEARWKPTKSLEQPVKFINRQVTTCFVILNLNTTIINIQGEEKNYLLQFYVINITRFEAILEKSWLWKEDPIILSWRE